MECWIVYVTQQGQERPAFMASGHEEAEEMAARIRRVAERLDAGEVTVAVRQDPEQGAS